MVDAARHHHSAHQRLQAPIQALERPSRLNAQMNAPMTRPPYVLRESAPKLSAEVSAGELLNIRRDHHLRRCRVLQLGGVDQAAGVSLSATQEPERGTVACIAGWVVVLTRGALSVEQVARPQERGATSRATFSA